MVRLCEREHQLHLGRELTIAHGGAANLTAVLRTTKPPRLELEAIAGHDQTTEPRALDADEQRVQAVRPALTHRRFHQHATELRERLDDQRARHDRMTGEVVGEDVVRERDGLEPPRDLGRRKLGDPVEKDVPHRTLRIARTRERVKGRGPAVQLGRCTVVGVRWPCPHDGAMRRAPLVLWFVFACTTAPVEETPIQTKRDAGVARDGGSANIRDAGHRDGGTATPPSDAGFADAGFTDAGQQPVDAGMPFTGCVGNGEAFDTFNGFWNAIDADYALFDLRFPNGDWNEVGRALCARVTAGMSEQELFDVLIAMAETFDDGHIQIESPSGLEGDGWVNEYPYYAELDTIEGNVENEYLDEAELTWAANDWFGWGTIGDVGYVSITSMEDLSRSGDEDDDRQAANSAMRQLLNDIGDSRAMIIDVRANEGGWDTVALDIARHFAGARTLAWSEQVRNGPAHDDFGPWVDTFVEAAPSNAFTGPVVLLTCGGSFSAAETFTLAMRVRDDVTVLGERGSGHFSDLIDANVPNGWFLELSGERYRAADGQIYEAAGVPVDVPVTLDLAALANGLDVQLDAALMLLAN